MFISDNLDWPLAVDEPPAKSIPMGVTKVRRQFMSWRAVVERSPPSALSFRLATRRWCRANGRPEMNGRITEEILSGFRTAERVLRPAKVKVASFAGEPDD